MSNTYENKVKSDNNQKADEIVATLPDFCRKYFNSLRLNKAPRTRHQYAIDIQRFFNWLKIQAGFINENILTMTAHDCLDRLTVEDIQEYVTTLTAHKENGGSKDYSEAFIARNIATLKSFFRYYYRLQEIQTNYGEFIDTPRLHNKEIKVLTIDQAERILDAILNEENMSKKEKDAHQFIVLRDYAVVITFFTTGIRVSELVGLDLSDFDREDGTIIVTRKGGDQDAVFLPQSTQKAINSYIEKERGFLIANTEEPALFVSLHHKRLSVRMVEDLLRKYARLAGVNVKVTPHTLRRTYGTNLYNRTGDIQLVADSLHHSSIETTRKHYARSTDDHKRQAAEAAEEMFKKPE